MRHRAPGALVMPGYLIQAPHVAKGRVRGFLNKNEARQHSERARFVPDEEL
jgi:hypothetical protein